MDYTNPNDAWIQREMDKELKDMSEDDLIKIGCLRSGILLLLSFAAMLICGLMLSCKTVEYVEMPSQHTEHHWHTDSVWKTDSVIHEKETIIMQLDSAAMAKYGITLKAAERAWLVRTAEMERQIQQLMQLYQQKDSVHDTIPYPVEVVKEVPADLTWWQQTRLHMANILLWLLLLAAVIYGVKWYLKNKRP